MLLGWASFLVLAAAGGDTTPAGWLEVVGEPGCPDAADVASAVERDLGRSPFEVLRGGPPPVRCAMARDGRGWRADIEIEWPGVERTARRIRVPGKECRRLLPALVLTLALALSAPAPSSSPLSSTEDAGPPPMPVPPDSEMPPALIARATPEQAQARWNLSAAAVVSSGGLPELAGGLALGGRRRHGRYLLGIEARSDHARRSQQESVAVSGWRASAALLPCLAPASLSGCLVTRLGLLRLHGNGARSSRSVQGLLAEVGARAAWQVALAGQPLEAHVELTLPVVRTRLLADGLPVWRAPGAVFSFGVAVLTSR